MNIYVSPSGKKNAKGSINDPVSSVTEALKMIPAGRNGTIVLREGVHRLDKTVVLDDTVTGSRVIRTFRNERAEITGGVSLSKADFAPLGKDDKLYTLKNRRHIVVCDLKKYGMTDKTIGEQYVLDSQGLRYFYPPEAGAGFPCEVYVNGEYAPVVSYPKTKALNIHTIIKPCTVIRDLVQLYPREYVKEQHEAGKMPFECAVIRFDDEVSKRIGAWKFRDNLSLDGAFMYDWSPETVPCTVTDDGVIHLSVANMYGLRSDSQTKLHFLNCPDELDTENEWYIDRETKKLYLYAPEGDYTVFLSAGSAPLFEIRGKNDVTFRNVTFSGVRCDAIRADGNYIQFHNCRFEYLSGSAILLNGYDNAVLRCHFENIGCGGVRVSGGDRQTLRPSGTLIKNSFFRHLGQRVPTYSPAVYMEGVGTRVSHNVMCDLPHTAVFFVGNDHIVEYNEIRNACYASLDAGAIYIGYGASFYGNIIRYNYIHDIKLVNQFAQGPIGIYLDDGASGIRVYGNIVADMPEGEGILVGGGKSNRIENNILFNVNNGIAVDNRVRVGFIYLNKLENAKAYQYAGDFWGENLVNRDRPRNLYNTLSDVPWKGAVWQKKYPALHTLSIDDADYNSPHSFINPTDTVQNNLCYLSGRRARSGYSEFEYVRTAYAIYVWNSHKWIKDQYNFADSPDSREFDDRYQLPADSVALSHAKGFRNIPFDSIGILPCSSDKE